MAIKKRDESLDALVKAEKCLEELEWQQQSPFSGPSSDPEAELVRLRAQVAELQGCPVERPRVRQRTRFAGDIPPMPDLIPAELGSWMDDRQAELQGALSSGDHALTLELSSKLAKGAERLVEMTRQDFSDDGRHLAKDDSHLIDVPLAVSVSVVGGS